MKSTTNRNENSLSGLPLETELRFDTGVTRAHLSGVLLTTIRMGRRRFAKNVIIHGYPAIVERVKYSTLLHTDMDVFKRKGWQTMFNTLMSLKKYYPTIDLNSPITLVEYRLVVSK